MEKPTPSNRPSRRASRCSWRKGLVVELIEGGGQSSLVVAGVVGDADGHVVSALERSDEVATANAENVAPELVCVALHHAFDDVSRLWTSSAAICVNWSRVGEYAFDLTGQVLEFVASSKHQSEQDGRDCWSEGREVPSQVGVDVDLKAGYDAVFGAADLSVRDVVAAVCRGDVVLGATLDPFDRTLEVFGDEPQITSSA